MRAKDDSSVADSPDAQAGFCGGVSDLQTLVEDLQSSTILTRQHARESLVALGLCAVPALMELLASPVIQLRWESAKALGEIARPQAIPRLVDLLEDEDHGVRWVAASALINIGPSSIPFVLQRLIDRPGSKTLRDTGHDVLRVLSDRYQELRSVLSPVMASLGEMDPASAIPPRALRAMQELVPLEATMGSA